MSRYKTLQSVAHNFGHSFTGTLNWRGDDYLMGHLLRRSRDTGEGRFALDLLSGSASPEGLLNPDLEDGLQYYVGWFPELLRSHDSDISLVSEARMLVDFDLSRTKPNGRCPGSDETPYVCRVEILDDRGRMWESDQPGWWTPEPASRGLPRRFLDWISRRRNVS